MTASNSSFEKITRYFNGDMQKVWHWWQSPHPDLSMSSPLDAIRQGKRQKVTRLINKMVGVPHG